MLRYDRQIKPGLVALHDRHPAGKRSGSILTTTEPARGVIIPRQNHPTEASRESITARPVSRRISGRLRFIASQLPATKIAA